MAAQQGKFHRLKTLISYNDYIDTCTTDLMSYGDQTGMRACFQELGLDTPIGDCYERFSEPKSLPIEAVV